ncbi:MAG TPA: aspartate 4-decarboxylase [Burkholderiales bacterium]
MALAPALRTSRARQRALSRQLSPFELKDKLIQLAGAATRQRTATMLNAGRGNPNWIATEPRDAFFLLGRFALAECRRARDEGILAGLALKVGIGQRFESFLDASRGEPGSDFLCGVLDYGVRRKSFDKNAWIHELADAVIGDNYPAPGRMLAHIEQVVHDYLANEMCDGRPPRGKYDLFATEGATAAMCYVFDTLLQNGLLRKGDTIAMMLPIFTPYLEIARLERFAFRIVNINASGMSPDGIHTWHYPDTELDKLANRRIKLAVCVNPSNPPSVALAAHEVRRITGIVKARNPDLIFITDDVYATFVPHFRSLMAEIPQNVIGVYSFSKNFGATGWRLGVVAIHEDNVLDRMIGKLPTAWKKRLNRRYGSLTLEPGKIKFIDRMVADSRDVALNHTAGLSTPQQVQMCFFALSHLLDETGAYKRLTVEILRKRRDLLFKGLGVPVPPEDPLRAWYYVDLDFMVWATREYGRDFVEYMVKHYEPVDLLFRVAEESSVVLLDGGGFGGPPWSIRVSLANLDDEDYAKIGGHIRKASEEYVAAWKASGRRG